MPQITLDFHTHLLEKEVKPRMYWKAVKEKKLDGIAITEHFDCNPGKAYEMLLEKKPRGIALIPGMELSTSIGHVLAWSKNSELYQVEELRQKEIPIEEAIKLAKKEKFLLSISHPWGLSYDSAAYILGERKLNALVERENIGVEAFNGMFGNVSSFFYATNWVKKPMNFFDFLEKSRIGKKTRLSKLAKKGKQKLDSKGKEIMERVAKPFALAEKASFSTAGSDAHKPDRIGTGIVKLESKGKQTGDILKAVQNRKNVKWLGPYVKETSKGYKAAKTGLQRKEVLSGIKYAAKRAIMKKVSRKKS